VDSLFSHVDARWNLSRSNSICRGSINVEPILSLLCSPTDSPRTDASASRDLHPAYKQTHQAAAQFKCHPAFFISADGITLRRSRQSGGVRKSGYHVDDAGNASNTEIGTCYLPSRTSIAITRRVHLAESGLSRAKRNLAKGISRGSRWTVD